MRNSLFTAVKHGVLDILFPPLCLTCNAHLTNKEKESHLCSACLQKIQFQTALFCPECRARLPAPAGLPVQKICHRDAYMIGSATTYDNDVLKRLIWQLKYQNKKVAARALGKILGTFIQNLRYQFKNPVLIPIPLHPRRERKRGFNQSEIIARRVSEMLGIPFETRILSRVKLTSPQPETKSYEERAKNVEGCFEVRNSERIKGKQVILIDDVFTSGATMNEAVKTLRGAGARNVIAFTVTRAG